MSDNMSKNLASKKFMVLNIYINDKHDHHCVIVVLAVVLLLFARRRRGWRRVRLLRLWLSRPAAATGGLGPTRSSALPA